jgi:hypothetical protein
VDQIHCHGIDIETAADVIRPRADEALNRGGEQTAGFELFFLALHSASAPLSKASAWPIASARA